MTSKKKPDFKVLFNNNRQWLNIFVHDVHPTTFSRWKAGRWGYFLATYEKHRVGEFGEVHFVKKRLRYDTIAHETFHVYTEWMWANGMTLNRKNEEAGARFQDEIVRKIIKGLGASLEVRYE